MTRFLSITLTLFLASPVLAGGKQGAQDLAKKIAPLLDPQTIAVAHANLDKVNTATVMKAVGKIADLKPGETAMLELQVKTALGLLKNSGAREVFAVSTLEDIPYHPAFVAIPVDKEEDGPKMLDL